MTIINNQPLPQELIQAGHMQLTEARSAVMGGIASELVILPAASTFAKGITGGSLAGEAR